jgi:hypothetical protein
MGHNVDMNLAGGSPFQNYYQNYYKCSPLSRMGKYSPLTTRESTISASREE